MSDGVLGLIGVGISLFGTIGITIYNQYNTKKQNEENEKTQRMIRASQRDFEVQMLAREQEFQEKITQKQIDANLKAKARIEWINGVRQKSSELISLLLSLQKDEVVFHEQWLKVEEVSELLKLFFSSIKIKELETEIYVEEDKIIISESVQIILFNENNNEEKNSYIRRYIECLIELYKNNQYKSMVKARKEISRDLSKEMLDEIVYSFQESTQEGEETIKQGINEERIGKDYIEDEERFEYERLKTSIPYHQKKLDEVDGKLQRYQYVINEFSQIVALYLKIEWDKAKEGE
ncbi:hypothetical protein [Enterococcus sp. C53]|uniref:hypothetical protein n=1 Tax=unclassified Enterococcus TaxID=2608891 RepID=UPI0034A043D4